jgi:prefoldin subunit 5
VKKKKQAAKRRNYKQELECAIAQVRTINAEAHALSRQAASDRAEVTKLRNLALEVKAVEELTESLLIHSQAIIQTIVNLRDARAGLAK